jgi:hypothetical protein
LIGFVGWKEPKQGLFFSTNLIFKGAHFANLWAMTDTKKQEAINMVFYYYYEQLCKAISISLWVTREVIETYGKIMRFAADRHHIYLQPHAHKDGERHIRYYKMTQEDIEKVIKDQPKIWATTEENPKEKKPEKDQEKEKEKEKDKGKAIVGEKQSGTIELGSSLRKKASVSKLTYQAVLHDNDFNTIADRVRDSMTEPIIALTTAQDAMKKTIEVQLMDLKSLVSHAPHVVLPTPVQSALFDPQGSWHSIISLDPINI